MCHTCTYMQNCVQVSGNVIILNGLPLLVTWDNNTVTEVKFGSKLLSAGEGYTKFNNQVDVVKIILSGSKFTQAHYSWLVQLGICGCVLYCTLSTALSSKCSMCSSQYTVLGMSVVQWKG